MHQSLMKLGLFTLWSMSRPWFKPHIYNIRVFLINKNADVCNVLYIRSAGAFVYILFCEHFLNREMKTTVVECANIRDSRHSQCAARRSF